MVRISGYGQDGPLRDLPGFGVIGEAMGGMRYVTGYPDRPPCRVGISIGDTLAGLYGVIGALLAIESRRSSGRGQVVDVALFEAVFSVMESLLPEFDRYGVVRERTGSILPGIAASNAYRCADGYVLIGANADAIFRRLANAIDRSDLRDDPALADNAGRSKRQQWLDEQIEAWTQTHTVDAVVEAMRTAEVPAGRIYSVADIVRDAQYAARQTIREIGLADGSTLKVPAVVPKLSDTPGGFAGGGPRLGEHTDAVLRELGFDTDGIAALRAAKVVG
jgi:formyl-CoA transferase